MPGTSLTRHNFTDNDAFLKKLSDDLIANGFIKIFPVTQYNPASDQIIVLEATTTVDTLAGQAAQPWRLALRKRGPTGAAALCVDLIAGTPQTISDTGVLATIFKTVATQTDVQPAGLLGSAYTADVITAANAEHRAKVFWSRADRSVETNTATSNPFSYKLTTTSRGIALHVWEPGTVLGNLGRGPIASTVVIQRLVDNSTGATVTTGKAPLHCLYGLDNKFYRLVIREADIYSPSLAVDAESRVEITTTLVGNGQSDKVTVGIETTTVTGLGNYTTGTSTSRLTGGLFPPIIENRDYIAITEDNNYVTTFPSGFCTSRYAYYGEMDLIAYTSADIVASNAIVQFTAYGESTPRKYQALSATGPNASKIRILQLVDGGDTVLSS